LYRCQISHRVKYYRPVQQGFVFDNNKSPETSRHTSVKERIAPTLNLANNIDEIIQKQGLNHFSLPLKALLNFEGNTVANKQEGILFSLSDYLELVDTTGRIIRDDKRGAIPLHLPPILERLGIDRKTWLINSTRFESIYQKRFAKKRRKLKQIA
jgi:hypothetical protein